MEKHLTELVFILDKSGSMSGLEKDTIGGYNAMLAQHRQIEGDCRITTVLFDDQYELLHDRIPLSNVSDITEKEYVIGGTTALLDAMGKTMDHISSVQNTLSGGNQAGRVLFIIVTDGEENASRYYSASKIKEMVQLRKERCGWEFLFLGANIDAIETASRFGIREDRAAEYVADEEGIALNFRVMSDTAAAFRMDGAVSIDALEKIRTDSKRRGK